MIKRTCVVLDTPQDEHLQLYCGRAECPQIHCLRLLLTRSQEPKERLILAPTIL